MRVAFIIQFNRPEFGGVYYSATTRIRYFVKENPDIDVEIFNVRARPFFLIRLFRFLITGQKFYPTVTWFNNLEVRNVYYSLTALELVRHKLSRECHIDYRKKTSQYARFFSEADLIAAHFGNGPGEIALYLSRYLNKKFTVTFHGSDIHTTPFLDRRNFTLCQEIIKNSSLNLFVSNGLLEKSLEIYDSIANRAVLYDGIETNEFNATYKQGSVKLKNELGLEGKIVGFVGNLIDVKNVLLLPDIFKTVMETHQSVSFIIIGNGILKNELVHLFRDKGVPVLFTGNIPHEQMPYYFSIMDVLVIPSKNEGLPRVVIEATACGVNCVGSKVVGIAELLSPENTFELNNDFEKSAGKRIVELLSTDQPPIFYSDRYDLNKIALKQGALFRNLMQG